MRATRCSRVRVTCTFSRWSTPSRATDLPEALNRVRAYVKGLGMQISFPVEVRFVAPDDIPLSTASGRETAYIAIHVFRGTPFNEYFRGVERIMDDYGGRPHWGKLHFQSAATLAPKYPRWDEAQKVRRRMDPTANVHHAADRARSRTGRLNELRLLYVASVAAIAQPSPSAGSSTARWKRQPVSGSQASQAYHRSSIAA